MKPVSPFGPTGNQAGVALPVALLGLVALSIVITGVLATSTTEAAISGHHRGAVRALYQAEEGLEAYIARQGAGLAATGTQPVSFTAFPGASPVHVRVALMGRDGSPAPHGSRVYAVQASPPSGGRAVGAMVRLPLEVDRWGVSVQQAFAAGSQRVRIGGSSFISGRHDRTLCATGDDRKAVTLSREATDLNIQQGSIDGPINEQVVQSGMTRYELERSILGGMTTRDLARYADIKFGDFRQIDEQNGVPGRQYPAFQSSSKPNSGGQANYANPELTPYNWGCPADVIDRARDVNGNRIFGTCALDGDQNHAPFIAINAGGGTVTLTGDHGQGMLLVHNGNLTLQGNFVFKGIIIVDGATDIRGGGGEYKIEGALVGFGDVTMHDPNDPNGDDNGSSVLGDAVIRYNSCAVDAAKRRIDDRLAADPRQLAPAARTFNWFEVVR
jgi:hypothetical protein